MKLKDFIFYKKLPIASCVFTQAVIGFILFASGNETKYTAFAVLFISAISFICLLAEYITAKKRIDEITNTIKNLDNGYLVGEVLQKPVNELEATYYCAMKAMSRSAVNRVESAEHEKDEYLNYVESWIHEIKTPLTTCSLILENGGDASKLKRELKRADNMTETILCYARLKGAEKDRIIRKFNVSEIIESEIKNQMQLLIAAGVSVNVNGDFYVSSNDKALSFIISQLLVNTAKYCPGCSVKINADNGVITYEDNGIGIPSHELPRVTERGFTGTNGRKLGKATGMGLYIVAELCKGEDISLTIESEQGAFTRFTLKFNSLTKM